MLPSQVITPMMITATARVILVRNHHPSTCRSSTGEKLDAMSNPASNALTNARKIEMVFIRTPPSGAFSINTRGCQSLQKDSQSLQNAGEIRTPLPFALPERHRDFVSGGLSSREAAYRNPKT